MTTRIWLMLAGLSFAAYGTSFSPSARALDSSQHITQYAHRTWTIREGFTKGPVFAITQTTDGYLWLGTALGLVRFDGVRAVPWVPPDGARLPSPDVASLLTAHDGALWIGTLRGLVAWKSGRATEYEQLAGLDVLALSEDPDGTVWAAGYSFDSNGKLCSIRLNQVHCDADVRLGHGALGLYFDRRGTLWVATAGGLWRWAPGTPQLYPIASGDYHVTFAEDSSGSLLIPDLGRVLRLNAGALETAYTYPSQLRNARGARALRDRDGVAWIGTISHGLIRVHGRTRETLASADGLTGDTIFAMFEDREGSLWVATDKGLDRFSATSAVTFSEREGLASPVFSLVAARDGSIWTSSGIPGRISRIQDGQVTLYRAPNAPSKPNSSGIARDSGEETIRDLPQFGMASLFQDAHGRISAVGSGIGGYFQDRRFIPIRDMPRGTIYAVAVADGPASDVWISNSDHGLVHLFYDRVQEVIPWSVLGDNGLGTSLAIDPKDESIWIGFSKGGITDLGRDHLQRSFTASDGLGHGRVSDLRFDGDGALWVATDGGLSRFKDGHWDTITANDGLPCNRLFWSVRLHDRSLWLYGECGLIHIASAELEAWIARKASKIRSTLLDAADGVSIFSGDLSQSISPKMAISEDGSIWFRTFDGLSLIRPHHIERNPIAPPVHIERMTADGVASDLSKDLRLPAQNRDLAIEYTALTTYGTNLTSSVSLRLPAQVRDLKIDYTALSFVAPEKVLFRYKLEGWDREWQDAGTRRQAFYSNLPPRDYRFRVTASNNSGVWNEQGAALDFSVAPAYWQTNWFRAVCLLALLGFLWAVYRLRLWQLRRAFNMTLQARLIERTRVARELHDTMLQSFQGVLLRFRTVRTLLPTRLREAEQTLDSAIEQTRAAIREGRDAVQGLRSSAVEAEDFVEGLKALGEKLASDLAHARAPALTLKIEGIPRGLRPVVCEEIHRIASEAMRNAYRHAEASRIEVELDFGVRRFELRVRDDGKGVNPDFLTGTGPPGHFGLSGMRERAGEVGGKMSIWSAPGSGTELQFSLSGAIAYVTVESRRRSWLRKRFSAIRERQRS
jgi:signal transduction histidine kinase/ligand-binding sensor domain-containing protein